MPRKTTDAETQMEIRAALSGLKGARAKEEAERWARSTGLHVSRIYEITKDLRPVRKPRSDKGSRKADLMQHPGMRNVAELVTTKKLDPDQAIEMTRANGLNVPVSLGTTRRYLRDAGLNRRTLRRGIRSCRRFEASGPLEIFQFDISGVKERWIDVKTRRILKVSELEVSKNHPNTKINRIPLWKFVLVDDYSRLKYVRFIACGKPDSEHVISFLLGAFRELGIPKILYTDNDAIIVSRRMRRAASILDRYFADSGGFKLNQHAAGNPQATGKVEVAHQLIEKCERFIGACDERPTLDQLNVFTERICKKVNWQVHRSTGEIPMVRVRHGNAVMRIPPPETMDSAFKSAEFERTITAQLTFSHEAVHYQLPRNAVINGERNPFVDWVGQKVTIVWPTEADYFVVIGPNATAYEIDRREAKPDRAGEFRAVAESVGQQAMKSLKTTSDEKRAARRAAGEEIIVPGIHVDFEIPAAAQVGMSQGEEGGFAPAASTISVMPRKKQAMDAALLAALTEPGVVPPSMIDGRPVELWSAAKLLIEEGHFELTDAEQVSAADMTWLKSIFAGRDEMPDTEIRAALESRAEVITSQPKIIEMRSA
jgi:hypothetical protein